MLSATRVLKQVGTDLTVQIRAKMGEEEVLEKGSWKRVRGCGNPVSRKRYVCFFFKCRNNVCCAMMLRAIRWVEKEGKRHWAVGKTTQDLSTSWRKSPVPLLKEEPLYIWGSVVMYRKQFRLGSWLSVDWIEGMKSWKQWNLVKLSALCVGDRKWGSGLSWVDLRRGRKGRSGQRIEFSDSFE